VKNRSKIEEVQFYLDRSQECLVAVLRSIITNPRLPEEEKFHSLKMLADHHQMVASFVSQQLREGELKGYKIAGVEPPAGV
jgi:hypothetical protein